MGRRRGRTASGTKNENLGRHVIILDVDGVVAPSGPVDDPITVRTSWTTWQVPSRVVEWMMMERKVYGTVFVWASSWGEESNRINRAVGLPDFPVIVLEDAEGSRWVKEPAVRRYLQSETTDSDMVVWLDSEMPDSVQSWAESRGVTAIAPHPDRGLSQILDPLFKQAEMM